MSGAKPGKKTRGRVKIKMEFIDNKLRRYTTFSKRKTGIMKKVERAPGGREGRPETTAVLEARPPPPAPGAGCARPGGRKWEAGSPPARGGLPRLVTGRPPPGGGFAGPQRAWGAVGRVAGGWPPPPGGLL